MRATRFENKKSKERGFSLLEVLVAVAILSLLSVASLRLAGIGVQSARHIEGKTLALITAENALVDALLDPGLSRGNISQLVRSAGQTWTINRTVAAMPDRRLLKIDVQVLDSDRQSTATLRSFKVVGGDG